MRGVWVIYDALILHAAEDSSNNIGRKLLDLRCDLPEEFGDISYTSVRFCIAVFRELIWGSAKPYVGTIVARLLVGIHVATNIPDYHAYNDFPHQELIPPHMKEERRETKPMKHVIGILAAGALSLAACGAALAQETTTTTVTKTPTTVTKTVQHPDGTFTVIEYPVGKETVVTLDPIALQGAGGTATILRDDSGTRIKINLTGIPKEVTAVNLYAVDPAGVVTSLGPVVLADGVGSFAGTTPLSKFMIVASPESTLATYDPNTKIFFRSAVPAGFAVIPHTMTPVGEKVGATTTPATSYSVPMLNIPAYKKGDDTKMKVNFTGPLAGARANVFITPRKDGPTEVKLRFHELKDAPAGQTFAVWAISPDNQFVKLGQVVNAAGRNEAEIRSEVALPDFGLFITQEDATATLVKPAGPSIGIVEIVK